MAEARIPVDIQVSGMALVVGPDDVLVLNVGRVSRREIDEITALFDGEAPALKALKHRVLIVTADQMAVVQGAREPA